ncbi:MAG: hypothetical protein NC331_10425 [Lachnospiraceae bacterium]|nr:hypothetical protein [Lachnospiraceae bacterium]MCM1239787.1 hypothetical protein [Lachnospiraceae bacterium]
MMNTRMLQTELYKIYSKKVIWVAMAVFLALFLLTKLQFMEMEAIKYTLEPMRAELAEAVGSEDFHAFVQNSNYQCTVEEMERFLPASIFEYMGQYREDERIYRSLNSDLAYIINNYYERRDNRTALMEELAQETAVPDQTSLYRAKAKLLEIYRREQVEIELNLEPAANNFIDVNHSAVFPGLTMLLIIVGLAGIYADEYTSGTQAALLTSRRGRRGVFFSKLTAAGIFIGSVVLAMECFFMLVTAVCFRAKGAVISAASAYGLSMTTYGGSVCGFCVRQILGTLLAGFTLGSIVMCISAYSRNALIPFFAAGVFYGGTAVYANTIAFPAYVSSLWSLPGEWSLFMLQTQVELVAAGHFTDILGHLVPALTGNVLWNILLMVICLALCYRAYTGKQVKD